MDDEITPPPLSTEPGPPWPAGPGYSYQTHERQSPHEGAAETPPPPGPPKSGKASSTKKLGPIATALAVLATKLKSLGLLLGTLLKFGKIGKVLLTTGSMFISVWAYAQWFGFSFALGFVVLIFVHEMGHVFAAWKMGIPVSAPIFIPFCGALILTKKFGNQLLTTDALIGIGGPAFGTAGAIACFGIYSLSGSLFFLGLAYITFMLNLFNLTPIYPLDGGWIVRAISPILWLIGIAILGYMVVTGRVRNPMIFILIILGLPTMWTEFRAVIKRIPSPVPVSFRWRMGLAYVGLIGICTVGMSKCMSEMQLVRRSASGQSGPTVALR